MPFDNDDILALARIIDPVAFISSARGASAYNAPAESALFKARKCLEYLDSRPAFGQDGVGG